MLAESLVNGAAWLDLPSDLGEINEEFHKRGYTDGLPIIPPTPERVARFVDGSGLDAADVVGNMAPANNPVTVQHIAINAVMAGCTPSYMPLLTSATKAVCSDAFNVGAIQATTSPAAPLLVVNGPVRLELDVNAGYNCMGPGWRANSGVGRALRLLLLNVGGGVPGAVDKATHGYPGKYSFCFAENEEESPWPGLHTTLGFGSTESVVTAIAGKSTINLVEFSPLAEDVLTTITRGISASASCSGYPLLVLSPMHARVLAQDGWTRRKLVEHLFLSARVPVRDFSKRALVNAPVDRLVSHAVNDELPLAESPDRFLVAVAGGAGGNQSMFVPTFGASVPSGASIGSDGRMEVKTA